MMKPTISLNAPHRTTRAWACALGCLTLLLCLTATAAPNTNVPTSKRPARAIIALPGTNAPIPLPPPSISDSQRRLRQIDLLDRREPKPSTEISEALMRTIANIAPSTSATDVSAALRMQRIRVSESLKANNALFRTDHQEEAIQSLQGLLGDITDTELREQIWTTMGVMRFKQQNYPAAAECFEEARRCKPHSVSVACNLAAAYMSDGRLEEAEALLSGIRMSLIEDKNLAAAIQFNLACIASILGRLNDALEHLSQAARLNAVFTGAHLGDTQLDPIRHEHRFQSIARQINFYLKTRQTLD